MDTAQYRRQQTGLRALTLRELLRIWPSLDVTRLDATFPGWALAIGAVIRQNRAAAIALAVRYVRDAHAAAGVPTPASVVPADPMPNPEQLATSLHITSVLAVKSAVGRGEPLEAAARKAYVLSAGAVLRHVLDAGRETVQASVVRDPAGIGWRRITSVGACSFCRMLAGRGKVYREATASFDSHDACGCTAEPVYH